MSNTKKAEAQKANALLGFNAVFESITKTLIIKEIKRSMQFMGVVCDSEQEKQLFNMPVDKLVQEAQAAQAAVALWRENEVAGLMQEAMEKQKAQEALPAIKKDSYFN